jgi:hypothetical protein
MAGIMVLVPLVLLCVDAVAIVNAGHSNQELATLVARAAANSRQPGDAEAAARKVVDDYDKSKSSMVMEVSLEKFTFDTGTKTVTVSTMVKVVPPVPIPGCPYVSLTNSQRVPIVALPPSV